MQRAYDPRDLRAAWVRLTCLVLVAVGLSAVRAAAQTPAAATAADPAQTPAAPSQELPTPEGAIDAQSTAAPSDSKRFPLQAVWDNGLRFESTDDRFHLHLGGRAQVDSTWLIGPQSLFTVPGGGSNGVGNAAATFLRRAVLQADGDIFGQFDYFIQFDFANASNDNNGEQPPSFGNLTSSPAPLNVWMQIRDVPYLGYVRVGNQNEPIGMTSNTTSSNLSFMERPDVHDAFFGKFDNGYALGITAHDWIESERLTWRYGIFRPSTDVFAVSLNKMSYGARVTGLPLYEEDGRLLVHLGLGSWSGEVVEDELRVRARPLLRNGPGFAVPVLVDTNEVPGSRQYTFAPEFAMVLGPVTVQAEWAGQFLTDAGGPGGPTVFYHGGYVEALCFLTDEHQEYDKRNGVFGRVIPNHDYHLRKNDSYRAFGAWQVGVRFSYVDLNDKSVQGGQLYDWTVGLNWYLNPNMKFQFNYIAERRDTPGATVGWFNGIGVRASYDF